MPALNLYGRAFHIASDDVPLWAAFGAIFHACWILLIALTARDIVHMPKDCHHEGFGYIFTVALLMICFTTGFVLEMLLIYEGCQGGPFEMSKRKKMPLLITLRLGNAACEILASAFGTYVLAATDVVCKRNEQVIFNPKREVLVLVIITWVFQLLILLNGLVWYNAWPENPGLEKWENRFNWLGRWICCQLGRRPAEEDEKRRRTLRRIARWVTRLLGRADLTPSDTALALMLVAALQRAARRQHIEEVLAAAREGDERGALLPNPAVSLMERAYTISALPTSLAFTGVSALGGDEPSGKSPIQEAEEVLIDILEEREDEEGEDGQASPTRVHVSLTAAATEVAVAPELPAQLLGRGGADGDGDGEQQPGGTGAAESLQDGTALGQGSPLEKFGRQVALLKQACITPSGMDEELRGDLPRDKALQLYTGNHWRVEAAILAEVEHFTRFAAGVYGAPESRSSWWRSMATVVLGRESSERKERSMDALNRADVSSIYERLYYEAVIDQLGDAAEILYVSVANAALAHLPYLIALDHASRSVVLALRGTTSVEDIITDSVAVPERLRDDWVPEQLRAQQGGPSAGALYAHAGIRAAAEAVLQDLDANRILQALLNEDYSESDRPAEEQVAKKTAGESAETQAGHYVAALIQRKLDCKGWRLVVTGHSLGAGAAALIAMHLYGRFPSIHCWALSPPGGLMSTNLSALVAPFVTSVVLGKDVVPRVSVANLGRLIDQMVSALALCKLNKTDVFLRWASPSRRHEAEEGLFWRLDEVPQEALDMLQEYNAGIEARARMLELVPPGRVIMLRPLKTAGARVGYDAVWAKPEEIIREGILVSPRMVEDHSCLTLVAALRDASASAGRLGAAEYFPPTVPGADDAHAAERPPGGSKGGDTALLSALL